ncbi:hypothetical protein [Bacteroides zhangwenhongii]|jgi:hypothetical protein|uniref:hypothetical protein n=1 Tax=Bacteroides zhangwenhongii TaxID=2650157 RepID=UPI00205DFFCA|nr:hypothetical protein [Bacteroides zhangwenhongii]DAT68413.1 MAG TPA: hypothetical protein [Caudoviricetes sp.]
MTQVIMQKIPSKPRSKYLNTASDLTFVSGGLIINNGTGGTTSSIEIIDNLDSIDANKALSANMGRLLNERKWNATGGTIDLMTLEGKLKVVGEIEADTIISPNISATQGNFERLFADSITSSTLTSDTILTDRITSKVFQSGNKGFSIDNVGNAEFENLNVRGTFNVNTINYNKINASNGEIWVTDAAQIISIDDNTKQIEVTENVFQTGDILLCQVFSGNNIKRCQIQIVSAITSTTSSALYSYINIENSNQLKVSDTLVRLNNQTDADRQQYIKLSPYSGSKIDIIDNDDVSVRLGSLSGITDEVFGTLSGYGLFAKDAYLRGDFATSTCRFNSDGSGNICNNMMNWDAAGNFNFNASISADKISGGTISSDLIEVNEVLNEPHWALKKDGSGYLSNSAISWDTTGKLQMNLGIKKQFKTIDINNYESTSFLLDLNDGYNFIFTKSIDNNDRTIQLPTDKSLDGIDVELVFRGNPGIIYVTTNRSYGFKYNAAWVNKVTLGTRDIRLKLAARINANKTYIEWWIENDSAFDLYSKISAKRYDYCENKYYN